MSKENQTENAKFSPEPQGPKRIDDAAINTHGCCGASRLALENLPLLSVMLIKHRGIEFRKLERRGRDG